MIGKKINQLATELAPVSTDLTIIGDPISGVSKKITLAQLGAIFSGAVSFYDDLASFPATGDINVIYCAKDTKKLYLWSGSAYVEVFPSQSLLDTYQLRSEKGNANGYASLDSSGKVPISQLPSSIMEYKGTWSASTNTPTLANGTGDTGDVYICNSPGSVNFGAGAITFAIGDYVIYSGSIWQRSSGAVGTVTSVGLSITGDSIGVSNSPITTSGTLALAFAGTSSQYINGAGNLITFPSIISQAANLVTEVYNKTGATLTKGTIVYINGGQGNLPTVTKAIATGDSTSAQTFGIVQTDITNNNNGYVVIAGRLNDLDTQAYTEGTQLYLSSTTAGTWTSTKQYAPAHLVYVGIVVRAHPTQGVVEVKIQNGYEMDELHNVAAQSPDNNDILQYKTATSLWTKVAGTTSNIAEGSNLYYTDARSRAALSFTAGSGAYNSTTGVITIPTNTNQLTNGAAFITLASLSAGAGISYNNTTGVIASTITQYTDALARAAISLTTTGTSGAATYNSTTGVFNIPNYAPDLSGYVPTNRTLTINGTAFDLSANRSWSVGTVTSVGLSSATSGVTIGSTPITTSGTITLAIATASGSQQGLLSSTDWTTFNNKQSALTNPVTGTGTTNYLPKFTGTSTIGNSQVFDNGTNVGIGTASPDAILHIAKSNSGGIGGQLVIDNPVADALNNAVEISFLTAAGASGSGIRNARIQAVEQNAGTGATNIQFWTYNGATDAERMRLDASGNLGLGVTPSAWNLSGMSTMQIKNASISGYNNNSYLGANWSFISGDKYIATGAATIFVQDSGTFQWLQAPSGTAGNAISFTQAMTLDASGRLAVGTTSIINDNLLPIQINAGASSQAYFASNNNGSYGLLMGYDNANGYARIRNVSNTALTFETNNTERLRIASTGAATFSSSVTANGGFYLPSGGSGTSPTISYLNSLTYGLNASGGNAGIYFGNTYNSDYSTGMQFRVVNSGGTNVTAMTVSPTGNVGIGTTSPSTTLTIKSTNDNGYALTRPSDATSLHWRLSTTETGADAYYTAYNTFNCEMLFSTYASGGTGGNIIWRTSSSGAGSLAERMRITSGGAVEMTGTIKTASPSSGSAHAWKLGSYAAGGTGTATGVIYIEVNGQIYSIPALLGTP